MKKRVHYFPNQKDRILVGDGAILHGGTIDHPDLSNSGMVVLTSVVISKKGKSFETQNTRYVPFRKPKTHNKG